jgi:hypothetical protein
MDELFKNRSNMSPIDEIKRQFFLSTGEKIQNNQAYILLELLNKLASVGMATCLKDIINTLYK